MTRPCLLCRTYVDKSFGCCLVHMPSDGFSIHGELTTLFVIRLSPLLLQMQGQAIRRSRQSTRVAAARLPRRASRDFGATAASNSRRHRCRSSAALQIGSVRMGRGGAAAERLPLACCLCFCSLACCFLRCMSDSGTWCSACGNIEGATVMTSPGIFHYHEQRQ